jgi:hypothetical protein
VGQRSTTETLAGVYQAFLTRRTWKQADLARELDVSSEAVRRVLHELQEKGMPLEREADGVLDARLDASEAFRLADVAEVDAYVKASLDGFNEGGTPVTFSFVVRNPEARWVKNNLLGGMQAEPAGDGIRVTFHGSALGRLARFVVSLGAAATAEPMHPRQPRARACRSATCHYQEEAIRVPAAPGRALRGVRGSRGRSHRPLGRREAARGIVCGRLRCRRCGPP